ncbi:MAG TPA: pyridoxal-phosphate dependent enzyme [Gemmatimonadaceae bacterium]|nr:pyridoxal-phosphate dependent enzyme [Gemmatimonadaceae bacterium]
MRERVEHVTARDESAGAAGDLALFDRFPLLRKVPRASLCTLPSPLELLPSISPGAELWIKRDDLNSDVCGGNKVRSLEFLLGEVKPGDTLVTVGGAGSTHVLAASIHASRLGATTIAQRWTHDMNPVAVSVSSEIERLIPHQPVRRATSIALAVARYRSITGRARYIPIGGATPVGALGHVNAALELAAQIRRNEMPMPACIVLPLGSGGTAAGMLVGLAIAGLPVEIVGARVGPRLVVNRLRVLSLARRTRTFIEAVTGERLPSVDRSRLRIVHQVYGGAYGRPFAPATKAAKILHSQAAILLDDTYSAKAWAAALDECRTSRGPVLFWLTFDARCLTNSRSTFTPVTATRPGT